jgi:hypothetical protein
MRGRGGNNNGGGGDMYADGDWHQQPQRQWQSWNDWSKGWSRQMVTRIEEEDGSESTECPVKDLKHKDFEIDISAKKILDVYNSKLLLTSAQLDERFHALALILKDWNKK